MSQTVLDPVAAEVAGGQPITLSARDRSLPELLSIAAAASRARTRIELTGTRSKPLEDLVRIAVTGGDSVVFGDDPEDRRRPSAPPARRWWFSRPSR